MFHISMGGVFQMGGGGEGQASFLRGGGTSWEGIGFGRGRGGGFKKNRKMGGCPLCPSPNTGNPALSSNM